MSDKARCRATGKVVFRSPEAAARAVRLIRRIHSDRVHSYRCDACRRWHVGHAERLRKL